MHVPNFNIFRLQLTMCSNSQFPAIKYQQLDTLGIWLRSSYCILSEVSFYRLEVETEISSPIKKMTFSEIKINFLVLNGQIFFSKKSKSHQILILASSKYVARNIDKCLKICASYCNLWSDFATGMFPLGVTHPIYPYSKNT